MKRRLLPPSALLLLALAACDGARPTAPPAAAVCAGPSAAAAAAPAAGPSLEGAFADAERATGVPAELLKAVAFAETRLQSVEGRPEDGRPAAFGVMALRADVLPAAAARAGVTEAEARRSPAANVLAAAALLSAYAEALGVDRVDLGAWAPAVARYGGIAGEAGRASYVHDAVYRALREGFSLPAASLAPRAARPDYPRPSLSRAGAAVPDHAAARWVPSPNFNARPPGEAAAMIVIHTCEGAYAGCWSWLASPASGVSAHYVVSEDGSEITQLVREADRAWHIGARYDCSLNGGFACDRNGQPGNDFTIGIEHAGYASQTVWPEGQIAASARLVCDVTRRLGIPRDRVHVVGHGQLQPSNRTDPGANWPWAAYLARIERECGDPAAEPLVVDSDNARNDPARARFEASAAWIPSAAAQGYFGSGYYFASAAAQADAATFHFFLPEAGTRTVEAWWTAGTNRSPRAPYIVSAADGRDLAIVEADQQRDGGRWNALGTWSFPAGWNRVRLSRWTTQGCVVVADAVRVR